MVKKDAAQAAREAAAAIKAAQSPAIVPVAAGTRGAQRSARSQRKVVPAGPPPGEPAARAPVVGFVSTTGVQMSAAGLPPARAPPLKPKGSDPSLKTAESPKTKRTLKLPPNSASKPPANPPADDDSVTEVHVQERFPVAPVQAGNYVQTQGHTQGLLHTGRAGHVCGLYS